MSSPKVLTYHQPLDLATLGLIVQQVVAEGSVFIESDYLTIKDTRILRLMLQGSGYDTYMAVAVAALEPCVYLAARRVITQSQLESDQTLDAAQEQSIANFYDRIYLESVLPTGGSVAVEGHLLSAALRNHTKIGQAWREAISASIISAGGDLEVAQTAAARLVRNFASPR
ncbi:hypothetical protein LUCX_158 [Xanthomonas phage vB_XciM_LucasX]|nr:hypothetical protein LUCX_158 [Xanthomonas phage vB_XciM_LucasX]